MQTCPSDKKERGGQPTDTEQIPGFVLLGPLLLSLVDYALGIVALSGSQLQHFNKCRMRECQLSSIAREILTSER